MLEVSGLIGTGLRLMPHQGWHSLRLAIMIGLGFGVWMALADRMLFAGFVPHVQRDFVSIWALQDRLSHFVLGAVLDEIKLRLLFLTATVWLLAKLVRSQSTAVFWSAILLTAFVAWPVLNVSYLRSLDPSMLTVFREVSLHGAAGVLWGWLYWRHGWIAAVAGHISAHLSLQPLLGVLG